MDKRDRAREVSPSYEPRAGNLTYEDYLRMPAGLRYELVEGEIRMVPSPSKSHQNVAANLVTALRIWARETSHGEVYSAPLDVLLSEATVVQPDVLFISRDRLSIAEEPYVNGPPDLVVEILSPSNSDWDRVTKRRIYSRYGVKEFWLVDIAAKSVELSQQENGQLVTVQTLREGSSLTSPLLPGFELKVEAVFEA